MLPVFCKSGSVPVFFTETVKIHFKTSPYHCLCAFKTSINTHTHSLFWKICQVFIQNLTQQKCKSVFDDEILFGCFLKSLYNYSSLKVTLNCQVQNSESIVFLACCDRLVNFVSFQNFHQTFSDSPPHMGHRCRCRSLRSDASVYM